MTTMTVGDLVLDESEYRTYLIVQEAVKESLKPYDARTTSIEHCLHGKNGDSHGLVTKVKLNADRIKTGMKVLYIIAGGFITLIVGTSIAIFTYILNHISTP